MMTRDEQVRAALKVLAPTSDQREACKERIEDTLNVVGVTNDGWKELRTKKTKLKLRPFLAALRRVQAAHNALPPQVKFYAFRDPDFKRQIEACDRLLAKPSVPKTPTKQRLAATEARALLIHYGRPVATTRRGKWCQLAAILYGDQSANFYHHCCEVMKGRNRV
jgi:hypothetical protein